MIAAVCGGIGEYARADPTIIGLIGYVVAWLIVPEVGLVNGETR